MAEAAIVIPVGNNLHSDSDRLVNALEAAKEFAENDDYEIVTFRAAIPGLVGPGTAPVFLIPDSNPDAWTRPSLSIRLAAP